MDLKKAEKTFQKYIETFDLKDPFMHIKHVHSYRVEELSRILATKMNLTKEEVDLATLIGLLHDIGRFYQIEKTKGFDDNKLDHADYGVMYLFEKGHIREFIEDNRYDEIIKKAVLYHSKFALPSNLTKQEELFCKLIRDADKIDILKVYVDNFDYHWKASDVSYKVKEDFYHQRPISRVDRKTESDAIVLVFGFLNDMNFKESFSLLRKTKNFENYLAKIEVSEEDQKEWQEITNYCMKLIKNGKKE